MCTTRWRRRLLFSLFVMLHQATTSDALPTMDSAASIIDMSSDAISVMSVFCSRVELLALLNVSHAFRAAALVELRCRPQVLQARTRMVRRQLPDIDEVVVVQVREMGTMGAYVSLLEYDSIEGMNLDLELRGRRIPSILLAPNGDPARAKWFRRPGEVGFAMVIRVGKDKGYIDLSVRHVGPEEAQKCEARFMGRLAVHDVLRSVAHRWSVAHPSWAISLEGLYRQTVWRIEEDGGGEAYAAFSDFIFEPETIRTVLPMLTPSFRAVMLSTIAERLKPRSWYQRRWRRRLSEWMDGAAVSNAPQRGSGGM